MREAGLEKEKRKVAKGALVTTAPPTARNRGGRKRLGACTGTGGKKAKSTCVKKALGPI